MPGILTTHVGSLPRGPELVPLLLARDKGEAYDAAAFDRLVQAAVDEAVRAAGRDRGQRRQRRRARQGRLLDLRHRAAVGLRRPRPRKPALDLAGGARAAQEARHIMGEQEFTRASCDRRSAGQSRAAARRHPPLSPGARRPATVRGVHERGLPGPDHRVPAEPVLPQPRGLSGRPRRGDAAGVQAIAASGVLAPARLPGPRDEPPHRLPGPERGRVPEDRRRQRRGAERRHGEHPARSRCACTCAGATTKGPHDFDIPLERDPRRDPRAHARRRSCSRPPTARHEHEWMVWAQARIPADKVLAPGLIDTRTNYVEPPELVAQRIERFAAIVGIERVDRQHRLRLRHLCRLRQDRPRRRLEEVACPARGRRHRRREAAVIPIRRCQFCHLIISARRFACADRSSCLPRP